MQVILSLNILAMPVIISEEIPAKVGMYGSFIKKVVHDMEIQPDDQILDLGCGTGRNARPMTSYLNNNGHITGLDISEKMRSQFREKFKNDSTFFK